MRLLALLLAAVLYRPASASILVIEQHDDVAEYQLEDSPSNFGPEVSMTGLGGVLVLSEPLDACDPVAPPPSAAVHYHWLLLVGDGNCSSGVKVLNAQNAGYVAAIVFNVSGDGYAPMESEADVNISSFYIGLSNGIMLRTNFLYGSGYSIYISGFFPYTFLAFIIPAMLLIVFCILVLLALMLYRCVSEYRRTARRLLPKRVLSKIPTRRYSPSGENTGPASQETCAICLEDYVEGDQLRVLPCQHVFHCLCVDPWLLSSRRVCPVCKRRLVSATVVERASDSEDDQLLRPYRHQRRPPTRRSYGSTLTARSLPPAPATAATAAAATAGDGLRVTTRRPSRRPRLSRRRPEPRPTTAAVHMPSPDTVPDVIIAANDVTSTADDVRLLGDDQEAAGEATAATPHVDDTEVTVAPCGGSRPKLLPGRYTRLQESPDGTAEAAVSTVQTTATGEQPCSDPTAQDELASEVAPPPPASGVSADIV